jgi:plasmid stabilization system protein ParE
VKRLVIRPLAKGDLDEQSNYIARDNVEAALRFLDAAEAAFIGSGLFPKSERSGSFSILISPMSAPGQSQDSKGM